MRKLLILNIPAFGHTNATLGIAGELVNQGYQVIYFTTDTYKQMVGDTGCEVRIYKEQDLFENVGNVINTVVFGGNMLQACASFLDNHLEEIRELSPDAIIHDSMCYWGKCISQILNIPGVSTVSSFAFRDDLLKVPRSKEEQDTIYSLGKDGIQRYETYYQVLKDKYGIKQNFESIRNAMTEILINYEGLNLIFTTEYLHPYAGLYDNSFKFVGPCVIQKYNNISKVKNLIYISLGTLHFNTLNFFNKCIHSLKDSKYHVIISTGGKDVEIKSPSSNIQIEKFVEQQKILASASLFICHAGINSINEAVIYNTPIIVAPVQAEQRVVARRIEELEIAPLISTRKCTEFTILQKIESVLEREEYKIGFKKYVDAVSGIDGNKNAINEIKKYIK